MTNMIAVSFAEESKAYQALSVLKQVAADGRIDLHGAALVRCDPSGRIDVPDAFDNRSDARTVGGGLLGLLVGALGGPVGMLIGWGTGALVGSALDLDRADWRTQAAAEYSRTIPPGTTVLLAEAVEPAVEVIDGEMAALGGTVQRRPGEEVLAELEAAEARAEEAGRLAHQTERDQKWAQRRDRYQQRKAEARAKLGLNG